MIQDLLLGATGATIVVGVIVSALRTVVLPRGARSPINRAVGAGVGALLVPIGGRSRDPARRDRVLALQAPIFMFGLLLTWLSLQTIGFTFLFAATGVEGWREAFLLAGSSHLTLGFAPVDGSLPQTLLAFLDATVGLALIALLIAYLPQMYAAFQKRETRVALLEVRAGKPAQSVEMLTRFHRIDLGHSLDEIWGDWEEWFSEVEESDTSLAPLVFYRSPDPQRSWIVAAGVVLDAAALTISTVGGGRSARAQLCIRAGFVCLRNIADGLGVKFDRDPAPDAPISVSREEFDAACAALEADGIELVADRNQAWRDFSGWRVNYDTVLHALVAITDAPAGSTWISDRRPPRRRAHLRRNGQASSHTT